MWLSSCGTWNLPKPEIQPVSPELAGGFLSAWPPGKSYNVVLVSGVHQNGSFVLLCFAFDDEEEVVAVVSAILFPDT